MRINNDPIEFDSTDLASATCTSVPLWLGHVTQYALQITVTGSPVGVFKVQFSCDEGLKSAGAPAGGSGVVNWTDLPSATMSVNGAASYGLNLADAGYNWIRVVYTKTSGSGTITVAQINTKGV